MTAKPLSVLIEEANEAWRVWRKDTDRQRADREALERLQPALSELRERFHWPRGAGSDVDDRAPQVWENGETRARVEYRIFRVFEAGGRWSPPED